MKDLKHIVALVIISGLILSCTKENFESPQQISISEVEKQQIRESSEFIEIQNLNSRLMVDITQKLLSNPKLIDDIVELNYVDVELIGKLEIKDELFQYDQMIINLTQNIISEHPVLSNLDINEKKLLINELLQAERENPSKGNTLARSSNRSNNPCQQQFERDFQYIHGQYDSAIMGATVAITSGGITQNPIPVYIGGITSLVAVGRAIYNIAVAIDDYNDCTGGGDEENPPQIEPECFEVQINPDSLLTHTICR